MFEVYDRVVSTRDVGTLLMLSAALIFAVAMAEVLHFFRSRLQAEAARHIESKLAGPVAHAVVGAQLATQPLRARAIPQDVRAISQFVASPAAAGMLEAPMALPFLCALWLMDPWLALVALLGLGATAILAWLNEIVLPPKLELARNHAEASQQLFSMFVARPGAAVAMGMESRMRARWFELQKRFLRSQAAVSLDAGRLQATSKFVQLTLGSSLLGLAAWLTLEGRLPVNGSLVIIASLLGARVLQPLGKVVAGWKSLVGARQSHARLSADTRIVLATPRAAVPTAVRTVVGEALLDAASYGPILDALADHRVRTVREVVARIASRGLSVAHVLQASLMLGQGGHIALAQPPDMAVMAGDSATRFNAHVVARAAWSDELAYLASPVTGGAVRLAPHQLLFLRALGEGVSLAAWPQYCLALMRLAGRGLQREGRVLTEPKEMLAELRQEADWFANTRLDSLRALRVL